MAVSFTVIFSDFQKYVSLRQQLEAQLTENNMVLDVSFCGLLNKPQDNLTKHY